MQTLILGENLFKADPCQQSLLSKADSQVAWLARKLAQDIFGA